MISGKDLIELGYKPGKWFKGAIKYANKNQLKGENLKAYLETVCPHEIEPREQAIDFFLNIRSETEEEVSNMESVVATMKELLKTPTLVAGAVMPDACPLGGGQLPVGGIVVAKNAIHPSMHSADICCSMMLTNFGRVSPKKVLDEAQLITHFGRGGRPEFSTLPEPLESRIKGNKYLNNEKSLNLARSHLGTQGDGNHFLYVGISKSTGETVMVTHHGSRGFGAYLFQKGMKEAEKFRRKISPNTSRSNAWIPFDSEEGETYWDALQIVREWTKLNHTILHDAVAHKIKSEPVERFWNEHNFVFNDKDLFYHAKGATPLEDKFVPDSYNGLRIIPLNMAEPILIVKGVTTQNNLGFAPHGAGRNISRTQHKNNNTGKTAEQIFEAETKGLDVRFFSGNIDISELPSAYKNAEMVKQQIKQFNLGEIVDEILPYGCVMAGNPEFEAPWRQKSKSKSK